MVTGTTSFNYLDGQPPNQFQIEPDNHYYQFRLHEARAIFNSGLLTKPDCLLLVSEVTSTFQSDQKNNQSDKTTKSLHSIKMVERNKPCQMGVRINLTDWIPTRTTDSCTVTIKYLGVQASPVKDLLTQLEQVGLTAIITTLDPQWEVSLKVSNMVGKILSYLLKEGSSHELFSSQCQFNLNSLRTGYYAAIGSRKDEEPPPSLRLDSQLNLLNGFSRQPITNYSYAMLHVDAVSCMKEEVLRQEPWWELLEVTKEEILFECERTDVLEPEKRKELTNKWKETISQVGKLTRQNRSYLLKEVKGITRSFSDEVLSKLQPPKTLQSFGKFSFSEDWKSLLEVADFEELKQLAEDYREELKWSREKFQQDNLI